MKPLALLIPAAVLLAACTTQMTAFDEGVRLYREGSYAAAREAFDTAARVNPRSATSINNRGVARARLGDLDGAIADYTEAMRLAPTEAEFIFNRGNAYAAIGNYPAAINDFTAAVALSPGYAQAYFNRGTLRAAVGDTPGAVSDWQWAVDVERDPWTKAAMRRSARLDYVAALPGPPRQAVINPSAAVSVVPAPEALDVRAYVARAMSREVDGDRLGAIADLRAAVAMETDATRRERIDHLLRALEGAR
jgi:tetratricopeptide (TPR) repeat protein